MKALEARTHTEDSYRAEHVVSSHCRLSLGVLRDGGITSIGRKGWHLCSGLKELWGSASNHSGFQRPMQKAPCSLVSSQPPITVPHGKQSPRKRLTLWPRSPPQGNAVAGAPRPLSPLLFPLVLIGVGTETFLQGHFKSLAFYLL